MLTTFFRSMILFLVAVISMRLMGKRQVGQLQPFELVVAIMIAELAATPMEDVGTPLIYGIVPMLALVILHGAFTLMAMKSQKLRSWVSGTPAVLVKNGVIQQKELEKLCFNLNDLLEELRMAGMLNPAEVGTAIMETSGKVSVFPKALNRPLTPQDMNLEADLEGIPLTLVLDGKLQVHNLKVGGLTESWLLGKLKALGYQEVKEVLLCSLDTKGMMMVQGRQADRTQFLSALTQDQINW